MTARKITRKELLKQDEFLTTLEKSQKFLENYRREIIFGAVGVLAVILIVLASIVWFNSRQAKAWVSLEESLDSYHGTVLGQTTSSQTTAETVHFATEEEKYGSTLKSLDEVVERYGSTRSGKLAQLYRGNCLMHLGRYAEAREAYDSFRQSSGAGFLSGMALLNIGRSHQLEGDLDTAAGQFQSLVDQAATLKFPLDTALFNLARCKTVLGQRDEGVRLFQRLLDEFPESTYLPFAEEELAELGVSSEDEAPPAPPMPPGLQIR